MAEVAREHTIVITHGNGPQVGLLALQGAAYTEVEPYPLDALGAQTEGMIGYLIEQELGNVLPYEQPIATILTQIEVDANDPAFQKPSKPIGPVYTHEQAERLKRERGWAMAPDNDKYRRVVPSPRPQHIFEIKVIEMLVKNGVIVICAGGGGILRSPHMRFKSSHARFRSFWLTRSSFRKLYVAHAQVVKKFLPSSHCCLRIRLPREVYPQGARRRVIEQA